MLLIYDVAYELFAVNSFLVYFVICHISISVVRFTLNSSIRTKHDNLNDVWYPVFFDSR